MAAVAAPPNFDKFDKSLKVSGIIVAQSAVFRRGVINMMFSKHPLASAALLVWGAGAAAAPLLQDATQALVVGPDLLVAQLAGTPRQRAGMTSSPLEAATNSPLIGAADPLQPGQAQPAGDLAGSMGLPVLRSAEPDAIGNSLAATPGTVNTTNATTPTPANSVAGRMLDSISADVWAQIAAVATAACAALGLLLLRRSAARSSPAGKAAPADRAATAKTDPKRRRVAYRL